MLLLRHMSAFTHLYDFNYFILVSNSVFNVELTLWISRLLVLTLDYIEGKVLSAGGKEFNRTALSVTFDRNDKFKLM